MICYATRWPIGRPDEDHFADRFFDELAGLIRAELDQDLPLHLPSSRQPQVAAADLHPGHLRHVTFAAVAASVATSERTLRRLFDQHVGMSWRDYLMQARTLRAMSLLANYVPSLVIEVAHAVGFDSVSAFTRAFVRQVGHTPSAFRLKSYRLSRSKVCASRGAWRERRHPALADGPSGRPLMQGYGPWNSGWHW